MNLLDTRVVKHMTEKQREDFLKIWKEAMPKISDKVFKNPTIFGTGGKIVVDTETFKNLKIENDR